MTVQITDAQVEQFAAIFRGLEKAFGSVEGKANKNPLTLAVYRSHLEGKQSIGVYPLMQDGTVWFAAIDFDRLKDKQTGRERLPDELDRIAFADARAVESQLANMGLRPGIFLERSKSKGFHLWVFFDSPVPARDVRRLLSYAYDHAVGKRASDPAVEIFPKQDQLSERASFGNYINLPFFNVLKPKQTKRVMIDSFSGQAETLESFLELAQERFPADALFQVLTEIPQEYAPPISENGNGAQPVSGVRDAIRVYPCTLPMLSHGLHEHMGRNQFGFMVAKRLRKAGYIADDGWVQFRGWNIHNIPPMDDQELRKIWDSSDRYSSMDCQSPLLEQFCRVNCPIHPKNTEFEYTRLRKDTTEPPRYRLMINNADVELPSFTALNDHRKVCLLCGEQNDWMPVQLKPKDWAGRVRDLLLEMETYDVPDEARPTGLAWSHIVGWLDQRFAEDDTPETIRGKSIEERGWVWFRGVDMIRAISTERSFKVTSGEAWRIVERHGGIAQYKRFNGELHRVWAVPVAALSLNSGEEDGDAS